MDKKTTYKDIDLCYSDRGEGIALVLLHGYLETREVWESFVPLLLSVYRVLCIDLPGHGDSGTWGDEHSMEDLAGAVKLILDVEGIDRAVVIGHSMGGYVAMAFAGLFPGRLHAYVLFHSTCFADTDEKKHNRDREIGLVLCGRKKQIISVNIPKAFAGKNLEPLREVVAHCREIACRNSDDGIIALLRGMKGRKDTSAVLSDAGLPLMLVGGMKDNYIPVEVFEKLAGMAPHARVLRLEGSGHMGFLEEADTAAKALVDFIRSHT